MAVSRQADELFDFKRIFLLMLGLVILPTILLSGFGILAIRNERAALEKRLQDTYLERVERIEKELLKEVQAQRSPPDEPGLQALLQRVVFRLYPEENARFVLVPISVPENTDRTLYELLRVVSSALPSSLSGQPPAPAKPEGESQPTPVASLQEGQGVRPLIRRPLVEPLQEYSLWAYMPSSDPVASTLLRNTIFYSTLLILLITLVIVGVVLTVRFIRREARLSRLQTDFVSNVSHELRTPLTSIRMFIETLQMGRVQDPAEVQECLDIISTETERLTRMIERILGWARMEAGRRIYSLETLSVQSLIDQTVQAFGPQRLQTQLELTVQVEPDLPFIRVDVEALEEALLNLLNNAVKYTGEKKRITLKASMQRGYIVLEVQDNGIGISPADRKRIFEKFYRADVLLSRKTEGSGLGLTIVKHIMDAHEGKIQVESELGVGSKFSLLLLPVAHPPRSLRALDETPSHPLALSQEP
ncbi:MAG: sensor histidine kinase [Myxococcota bacterium]